MPPDRRPPSARPGYTLVGIGKCTIGLTHTLEAGPPVTVGRHSDCTIAITRRPTGSADLDLISRHHALVENDPNLGWCVCDCESTNGTSILRSGLPPAIRLQASVRYPITADDIIELAASEEFQFACQTLDAIDIEPVPESDAATRRYVPSSRSSLQRIINGAAADCREFGAAGVEFFANGRSIGWREAEDATRDRKSTRLNSS